MNKQELMAQIEILDWIYGYRQSSSMKAVVSTKKKELKQRLEQLDKK